MGCWGFRGLGVCLGFRRLGFRAYTVQHIPGSGNSPHRRRQLATLDPQKPTLSGLRIVRVRRPCQVPRTTSNPLVPRAQVTSAKATGGL